MENASYSSPNLRLSIVESFAKMDRASYECQVVKHFEQPEKGPRFDYLWAAGHYLTTDTGESVKSNVTVQATQNTYLAIKWES